MTDNSETPLKPCPFCGGEAQCENTDCFGHQIIECYRCNLTVRPMFPKTAAEAWNSRAESSEAVAHTDHPMRHYDRTCPACNPDSHPPDEGVIGEVASERDDLKRQLTEVIVALDDVKTPRTILSDGEPQELTTAGRVAILGGMFEQAERQLAEARERTIEECAKVCDEFVRADVAAKHIRALTKEPHQ